MQHHSLLGDDGGAFLDGGLEVTDHAHRQFIQSHTGGRALPQSVAQGAQQHDARTLFPALDIFGSFSLPAVVAPDKEAAKTAFAVHRLLVMLLVLLIAMHVGAALYHYLVRKDNVLGRMAPSLLRRSAR